MKQHTVTYEGYTVGDKVWVWAYWLNIVVEVEIIGMELNRYPEDPDKWHIGYSVNIQAPNGDINQHTYDHDELYDTKKEALEAAIKEQMETVSEWRDDLKESEETLAQLKADLEKEA